VRLVLGSSLTYWIILKVDQLASARDAWDLEYQWFEIISKDLGLRVVNSQS